METKKILIIDDDEDIRRSFQVTLESKNYEIDTASNTITGMEKIKNKKPDLLILDVMMDTDLEGHRFAHTIKNDPDFRDIPILIITGMLDSIGVNIRDAFDELDALPSVYFMDKPIDQEELLTKIKKII
ncbi:MAG: response regulator [Bacteroidales bacterium]|nr:response regulator [Bacteroidales bacterium]